MTNEQILHKAVDKALANGWEPFKSVKMEELYCTFEGKTLMCNFKPKNGATAKGICTKNIGRDVLLGHDFAEAFWGEGEKVTDQDTLNEVYQFESDRFKGLQNFLISSLPAWQYHLQQMVLEEDPIKYLEKFI